MVGGGVGRLGAGGRLLVQRLQAARETAAPTETVAARAAAATQRHLPDFPMRARLLGVLLPERWRLLHCGHLRQPDLQLRVPQRLRGAAMRVQRPGRLVRAHKPAADDGDGVNRGRRHRGGVPRDSSLLRRLGAAAPGRGRQGGRWRRRARARAARGCRGAAWPAAAAGARAAAARRAHARPLARTRCS